MSTVQRQDLHGGVHAIVLLAHGYDAGVEIDVEPVLDARCVVEVRVCEDGSRGAGVVEGAWFLARPHRVWAVQFAEAEVVLAEGGVQAGDEDAVGVELSDVGDGARVGDGVGLGAELGDPEVSYVDDSSAAAREEDGGVVGEKFEGEDVRGIVCPGEGSWADKFRVVVPFVDGHNSVACPVCEKEVGCWWSWSRGIYTDLRSL